MTVTEESRHLLYERLDEVLGHEQATTLMEHLPPVGWADVTTKKDLDTQSIFLKSELDQRFTDFRSEMDGRFAEMRSEMDGRFAEMRSETNERFAKVDDQFTALRTEMNERFDKVDGRFEKVDDRLGGFEERFDNVVIRLERVEAQTAIEGNKLRADLQRELRVQLLAMVTVGSALAGVFTTIARFV